MEIYQGLKYDEAECYINPGEKIILYTDGIIEARYDGNMNGEEGIERVLREYGSLPPDKLAGQPAANTTK